MTQIAIDHVTKTYRGVPALQDVSLNLPARSMTAILGPSGCGKTTLLRSLAGFIGVDSGDIWFGKRNVTKLPPQERGTAMFFQNYALWPHMSVYDNIAYGLRLRKMQESEIRCRVTEILRMVELGDTADVEKRRPPQFSGGQQQRIALARALVIEPKLLLLDEPLSNLDAKVRQKLRVEIRQLQRRIGITAVYVTHDQDEALAIADQVVVMNKGLVMQMGTSETVYTRPCNLFMAEFLGKGNVLRGQLTAKGELTVDGQRLGSIAWTGADQEVSVILRSTDLAIGPVNEADISSPNQAELCGTVAERLFSGAICQHLIHLGEQSVFVDWAGYCHDGPVKLTIPYSKVMVFMGNERLDLTRQDLRG